MDEWIYFLKNEEIKPEFSAKGLKEAEEKLSIMKLPEEERKAYEVYQDDLHYQASMYLSTYGDGLYEGEAIGLAKGIDQAKREIALNLIKQGISIDAIKLATGLSDAEIKLLG